MFEPLLTDRITIISETGERFEDLPAAVEGLAISIDAKPGLVIREGNRIERRLSNGVIEQYTVVEANFAEAFHGMPAFYDLAVKRVI